MKKMLTVLFFMVYPAFSFGQCLEGEENIIYDFDTTYYYYEWSYFQLTIDTVSNPDNIWQIGKPHKETIDTAKSGQKVIITDTSGYYPPNDTSSFIVTQRVENACCWWRLLNICGYYYVNTDSLHDYGKIEISFDNGNTWVDILSLPDTIGYFDQIKPVLTGNSNGWKFFYLDFSRYADYLEVDIDDTLLYRFSFISDSIPDSLDGLAFDYLTFVDYAEYADYEKNDDVISIYPNPVQNVIYFKKNKNINSAIVKIYDIKGNPIYENDKFEEDFIDIKKLNLPNGVYMIKFNDGEHITVKKIIVKN